MFLYTTLLIEPLAIKAICVITDKGKGFQIFPIQYQMIWHFEYLHQTSHLDLSTLNTSRWSNYQKEKKTSTY